MPPDKPWGLVSLDWSVAKSVWDKNGPAQGTCEATSVEGCRQIKAASPQTRCFMCALALCRAAPATPSAHAPPHHTPTMELALEAQESQRAVMYDATKAHYFLQYTDGKGNKNGTIYNENGGPGNQFFWDFRVSDSAQYYIDSVLNTTLSPFVDGTFTCVVSHFSRLPRPRFFFFYPALFCPRFAPAATT